MKLQKPRVLQVGKFFYPDKGGIETVTKNIFEGLLNNDFQTDIICFKRSRGTERKKYGHSFVLKCGSFLKLASTPISFSFFYWFSKLRNNYEIVHIHCPNPLAAIALAIFPVKGKVIVHWHSDVITHAGLYFFFKFFEAKLLKRADLIIATTPVYASGSHVLQPFLYKCDHLLLCVDGSLFTINDKRIAEIKNLYVGKKIVFSLGRFVYYKGYEYLIRAAKLLPDDYVILIGGGGPLQKTYQSLIEKFGLQNKVILVYDIPQHDVGNYYSACDLYCLPSCEKAEAFGLVMLEAMFFGKPIVATNIPDSGVPWVNADGISGVNVANRSPQAIADGIVKIMEGDYEAFCSGARSRFNQMFTFEEMNAKLQAIYEQVLESDFVTKAVRINAM